MNFNKKIDMIFNRDIMITMQKVYEADRIQFLPAFFVAPESFPAFFCWEENMEIVYRRLADLLPYENNPRDNMDAVEFVAASIKEFGFKVPIVITAEGVIVAGHTRYRAARQLGMEEVPCLIADDLTEDQIRAYRLADNKTGEMAEWDEEKLAEELLGIQMGMDAFGFDMRREMEEEMEQEEEPAPAVERVVCPRCGRVFEVEK